MEADVNSVSIYIIKNKVIQKEEYDIMNKNNKCSERLGEERLNRQGCLMKIVDYIDSKNIIVEFQDNYKARIHTEYYNFKNGVAKNPYHPIAYGVGMIGIKYPSNANGSSTKEYQTWKNMLRRCYGDEQFAYRDVICCDEWLLYENFYEWLHSQENFDKWYNNKKWHLDKDILIKGNKIYSPNTCCLVPHNVNLLFTKKNIDRNGLPIGVCKNRNGFKAEWNNQLKGHCEYSTTYAIVEFAFQEYKSHKEEIIKQVAQIEFEAGNITEKCYNAMMNYEVEITD